jgi:hypothetical protein
MRKSEYTANQQLTLNVTGAVRASARRSVQHGSFRADVVVATVAGAAVLILVYSVLRMAWMLSC